MYVRIYDIRFSLSDLLHLSVFLQGAALDTAVIGWYYITQMVYCISEICKMLNIGRHLDLTVPDKGLWTYIWT